MGALNHLLAGGWHWSELPTTLWETSSLQTLRTSQQLGWQESRVLSVLSSSPISVSASARSDKLFYSSGELLGKLWRPGFVLYLGWCVSGFFAVTSTRPSSCAAGRA